MTPCRKKQYSKILINTSVHSCTKFSRHAAGAEFYMFDPLCHLRNTCTHVCVSATAGAAIASNRWTCRMTCLKIAALFGRPTSFGSFFLEQGVPNKIVILLGIRHGPTFCSDAGLCLPKICAHRTYNRYRPRPPRKKIRCAAAFWTHPVPNASANNSKKTHCNVHT